MEELKKAILSGDDIHNIPSLEAHADWADEICRKRNDITPDNIDHIIEEEIGLVFANVLEHCGVFKDNEQGREGFRMFIQSV